MLQGRKVLYAETTRPGTPKTWQHVRPNSGSGEQTDVVGFRPGVDTTLVGLVVSDGFAASHPALSPDNRWLAYSSDESGRNEVYVRPFPNVDSTRVTVSTDGGIGPLWAHNGRELFYVDANRALVAAQFDTVSGQVLERQTLFTIPAGYAVRPGQNFYDVALDDQRFLMVRDYAGDAETEDAQQIILVQSFFEELKERVGG